MQMTPFLANDHHHPPMEFKPLKSWEDMISELLADAIVSGMEETHRPLQENLLEAQVL